MRRWAVLPPRDSGDAISDGPQRVLGWGLDAVAAEDWPLVEQIWQKHGALFRTLAADIDNPDPKGGSGNWLLNAASFWCCAASRGITTDRDCWRLIAKWCGQQLGRIPGPFQGLGWIEPLSNYTDGCLAGFALVMKVEPAAAKAAGLPDLLEAWGYLMSLFGVPAGPGGMTVVAPGARMTPGNNGNAELSYLLRVWTEAREPYDPRLRPDRGWGEMGQPAWGLRAAWAAGSPLSDPAAGAMSRQVNNGDRGTEIVDALNRLGVTLRIPFHVERFASGETCSWMGYPDKQSQIGATGGRHGASYVDGKFYWLCLLPWPYNFGDGRRPGKVTVWRDGEHVRAQTEGATGFKELPPDSVDLHDRETGFYAGSVPVPAGPPLYHVIIDQTGARFAGEDPMPPDRPDNPRPDPDPPPAGVTADERRKLDTIARLVGRGEYPDALRHARALARAEG